MHGQLGWRGELRDLRWSFSLMSFGKRGVRGGVSRQGGRREGELAF